MTLQQALEHAAKATAWGLDMSYEVDQDALQSIYRAYVQGELIINAEKK
jgi:hypothetical protein